MTIRKAPSVTRYILLNRWPQKLGLVALSITTTFTGLAIPWVQYLFLQDLDVVTLLIASALAFISYFTFQLTNYLGQREAIFAQEYLGEQLYQHSIHLKESALQAKTTGEIVSLYSTDIPSSTMWLEQTIPYFLTSFFPLLVAPIFLDVVYQIPWPFTFGFIAVLMCFNFFMALRQSKFFFNFKQLAAERMGVVNEWIQNIRSIKVLNWIEIFEKRIKKKRILETDNRIQMVTNGQIMNSFSSTINFWINLFVLSISLYFVRSDLTGGQILTILWICGVFLSRPLRQLPWLLTMFFDAKTSIQRIQAFQDLQNPESKVYSMQPQNGSLLCKIEDMNVQIGDHCILSHINLEIEPGELVAVIGPIGSGKSTLLKAIAGEYPFEARRFEIDPSVDYLPQSPFVLSATIRENVLLKYEDESANSETETRVHRRLLSAGLSEEVNGKILRQSTLIGERGLNLSGGQKQRLALARTLERSPKLFLLDDPLSAVDLKTEQQIVATLFSNIETQSSFIISTHRFSILPSCDRVLFMKDGKIKWEGLPSEIANNPEVADFINGVSHET